MNVPAKTLGCPNTVNRSIVCKSESQNSQNVVLHQISLKPKAKREFSKLPGNIRKRIATKITSLSENPRPAGVEKMKGSDGLYRVRVGAYRVIYQIFSDSLIVLVVSMGHRSKVYNRC